MSWYSHSCKTASVPAYQCHLESWIPRFIRNRSMRILWITRTATRTTILRTHHRYRSVTRCIQEEVQIHMKSELRSRSSKLAILHLRRLLHRRHHLPLHRFRHLLRHRLPRLRQCLRRPRLRNRLQHLCPLLHRYRFRHLRRHQGRPTTSGSCG